MTVNFKASQSKPSTRRFSAVVQNANLSFQTISVLQEHTGRHSICLTLISFAKRIILKKKKTAKLFLGLVQ